MKYLKTADYFSYFLFYNEQEPGVESPWFPFLYVYSEMIYICIYKELLQ